MKKVYVVGFAFSPALNAVVLIQKSNATNAAGEKRPDWLQGKFNGVGTDVAEDQQHDLPGAMAATFKDRTGADVRNWRYFHHIENPGAIVVFYMTVLDAIKWQTIRKTTAEEVRKVNLANIAAIQVVGNLKWLIPMALDKGHVASMSADSNGMVGDLEFTDLTAWAQWQKQTSAHMQPENLIPAEKLADTPTTDKIFVTGDLAPQAMIQYCIKTIIENIVAQFADMPNDAETHKAISLAVTEEITELIDGLNGVLSQFEHVSKDEILNSISILRSNMEKINAGVEPKDVILLIAGSMNTTVSYVAAACEVFKLAKKDVMRMSQVGADALAQFPIDTATGLDTAKAEIAKLYNKLYPAKEVVPGAENKGQGVENSPQQGTPTDAAKNSAGGSENNSAAGEEGKQPAQPQEEPAGLPSAYTGQGAPSKEGQDPKEGSTVAAGSGA